MEGSSPQEFYIDLNNVAIMTGTLEQSDIGASVHALGDSYTLTFSAIDRAPGWSNPVNLTAETWSAETLLRAVSSPLRQPAPAVMRSTRSRGLPMSPASWDLFRRRRKLCRREKLLWNRWDCPTPFLSRVRWFCWLWA